MFQPFARFKPRRVVNIVTHLRARRVIKHLNGHILYRNTEQISNTYFTRRCINPGARCVFILFSCHNIGATSYRMTREV